MSSRIIRAVCVAQLWSFTAYGQAVIPPAAQPGAIERQQKEPPEPRASAPLEAIPSVQVQQQAPPANAAAIHFDLKSLDVTGNTVLATPDLLAPYASLIGTRVSVATIYEIAGELTARYRNAGFILSSVIVPVQSIPDGRVKLRAVEGYLSDVKIEGDVGHRDGMFATLRERLTKQRPLHVDTLERHALLLNDLHETTAQFIIAPSESTPESAQLTIRISKPHVTSTFAANNRGSEVQGPTLANADVTLNSIFGLHEATSVHYLQAEDSDELKYLAVVHRERLTASGLDLSLNVSRSDSAPELGETFQDFNLESDTRQAGIALSMPLVRSRVVNVHVRGALTYHEGVTDSVDAPLTSDTLAAIRVGLAWDGVDAAGGVNLVDLEYSQGLDALGASEYRDPYASRAGGRPDFSKVTLYLARLQSLGGPFSALLALNGQYAATNLLAPEEFAFGGEHFGRAYDPSEMVGDSGAAAKLELRYSLDNPGALSLTLYAFGERGKVWQRLDASEVGASEEDEADCAGGGIRVSYGSWLNAYVEAAVPIDRVVAAEGTDDTRVFGGLQFAFGF